MEHIRVLSEEIGVRMAGSPEQEEAVAYAQEQLRGWGYEVQVQPFQATGNLLRDVTVAVAGGEPIEGAAFSGSATGAASGLLIDAGTGREEDFPPDATAAIVLVQRQDVRFSDMAARSLAAGASALVIANSQPGPFQGGFEQEVGLPVITIGQEDGQSLRDRLAAGQIEVTATVSEPRTVRAYNVIARPPGGTCTTISGGHIDSVPWAPGANDNASGSALVLELARVASVAGLSGHCFALFGAEEEGLLGSAFFVSSMSAEQRSALEAYYNYDVVAGNAPPMAIGSQELLDRAGPLAVDLGLDVELSSKTDEIGSDHRSFLDGGVPSLMLTTPDFERIHTPGDVVANLGPAFLEGIAQLGLALLAGESGLPPPPP